MPEAQNPDFPAALRTRSDAILNACTRCGACFDACPMTGPAGIADADGPTVVGGVLSLLRGEEAGATSIRWAETCSGSGACIPACPESVNPRFMLSLARLALRRRAAPNER